MHSNVTGRICSRAFRGAAATALLVGLVGSAAQAQSVDVGDAGGPAGTEVTFDVSWTAGDSGATGLTVDVGFGDHPINVGNNNRPACTFASAVSAVKEASSFSFRPARCTVGEDCTAFRAGIISFSEENNALPVPEGVIYTCTFTIPGDANEGDEFAFDIDLASYILPDGSETDVTEASSGGVVRVVAVTATPTATETPVPPTATNTVPPATATPTRVSGGGDDDDGCQVVAPANANSGWLLLFPAAVLIWRRRRAR